MHLVTANIIRIVVIVVVVVVTSSAALICTVFIVVGLLVDALDIRNENILVGATSSSSIWRHTEDSAPNVHYVVAHLREDFATWSASIGGTFALQVNVPRYTARLPQYRQLADRNLVNELAQQGLAVWIFRIVQVKCGL